MFEPSASPRVFGLPPGADFPKELIAGLEERLSGQPAEAWARVELIVNTRRMARRIRALFDAGPPRLLPRIRLLSDLGTEWGAAHIPPPVPALRQQLELIQLIARLLDNQPGLAPRAALYDLADSLATLMDEMQGEGVEPSALDRLDITDQSGHWERIRAFLGIVQHFSAAKDAPGHEARQRRVIEERVAAWQSAPPEHPVILAGSTGSRGATQLLMQAVAQLPQGAVILPGYDFDMPDHVWGSLGDAMLSGDHPQYRFAQLRGALGITQVAEWTPTPAPSAARAKVLSLALRPAPITDQWLSEGPNLPNLESAMEGVTLLEAPSQRAEAVAIAMRLRQAAEDGITAALITPDRGLTRQVSAALDRWGIIPDDSAGTPLHLSPPGRFLRHVAELGRTRLTAADLLTLLKHPLTHTGADRGEHLLLTRALELHLRRHGPPYPEAEDLITWAAGEKHTMAERWAAWIATKVCGQEIEAEQSLTWQIDTHIARAEAIAAGSASADAAELWAKDAGRKTRAVMDNLSAEATHGGMMTAADYGTLVAALLAKGEARGTEDAHPNILIWGTLEARVQGADLLILAGLNEGTWPAAPSPDPWLNRELRHRAGLLLPERRIGLAAHDFQQAACAREVWITRSIRSDEAETVVSRWVNRLQNLLDGLPEQGGKRARLQMRARGQAWLDKAALLETPEHMPPALRPAPCPPLAARPNRLSVTEIKRLIRDPYAIYGKHTLRLRPLNPLMQAPDALLRGIVLHKVLEDFIRDSVSDPAQLTPEALIAKARIMLEEHVPWAEARAMWLARLARVAEWFIETEEARRALATPTEFEAKGAAEMADLGFTLVANADRIDLDANGTLHIFDYKTGTPPSKKEQEVFDKQLLLEAAIAEAGGFGELAPAKVARALYIGLGSTPTEMPAPLEDVPPAQTWAELRELITAYRDIRLGYTARRALKSKKDISDYDGLSRFGEWDITDAPLKLPL